MSGVPYRSTKAGVRTPATPQDFEPPDPLPQRSTKAGVRTPATLVFGAAQGKVMFRSTKAGVRTPATHGARMRAGRRRPALNEGRGSNPGDTGVHRRAVGHLDGRSTKAGVRTPATLEHRRVGHPVALVRSTKAGVRTPATPLRLGADFAQLQALHGAQRRPGFEPRRHLDRLHRRRATARARSTKAGVRTPATLSAGAERVDARVQRSTKAGVRTPATLLILAGEGPIERIAQYCGFERPD